MEETKDNIKSKDKEIADIKNHVVDVLQTIRDLNESSDPYNLETIKEQISGLVTNTIYELVVKEKEKLSTTDQSDR